MRILSLGGGVQSTVMCLMAEAGDFGHRPDFAIFADTHWEPQGVYRTLDWLREQVSFPIIVTDNGRSLKDDVTNGVNAQGKPWLTIPAYLANQDGSAAGINWRQCTKNYKLDPIRKKAQELLGVSPREAMPDGTWIEMWLGITTDEIARVKTSRNWWIGHRYPLVDDVAMTREDCLGWFEKHHPGRTLSRSACIACPFRSSRSWLEIQESDPERFAEAVELDRNLRTVKHNAGRMFHKQAYLHHRRIPLLKALEQDQQKREVNGFINECEGHCGI